MNKMVCLDYNGVMHINEAIPGDTFCFNDAGRLIGFGGTTESRRVAKRQMSGKIRDIAYGNQDFFGPDPNNYHYIQDDVEVRKYKTGWYLIKKRYHVEMDWLERLYIIVDKNGKTYEYWRFVG